MHRSGKLDVLVEAVKKFSTFNRSAEGLESIQDAWEQWRGAHENEFSERTSAVFVVGGLPKG
jgi:hypothetical protein